MSSAPPQRPVVRFAPSPNGRLHLGHARSALMNGEFAAGTGGILLLRIEDIDRDRCRPEFEAAIIEDLGWLGLDWPEPVWRQSERFETYRSALDELRRRGLLYPAFMSRGEIRLRVTELETTGEAWPRDPDGAPLYPGGERDMGEAARREMVASGRPFAWRLDMARALAGLTAALTWREAGESGGPGERVAAEPGAWGDVILARRDTPTSYHLAVTVDDHAQGITDIIRGEDLQAATSVHRLLQVLLGFDEPVYRHHRLVTDAVGRKLSKSHGDTALAALRAGGASREDIRRWAGIGFPLKPFVPAA